MPFLLSLSGATILILGSSLTLQSAPPGDDPSSQRSSSASHVAHGDTLPILIDGAKEPERISDALAYFHLFSVILTPSPNAMAEDTVRRREALFVKMGIGIADATVFLSALQAAADDLRRATARKRNAAELGLRPEFEESKAQEEAVITGVRELLAQRLSVSGSRNLARYVQQVKRQIVVYGNPQE